MGLSTAFAAAAAGGTAAAVTALDMVPVWATAGAGMFAALRAVSWQIGMRLPEVEEVIHEISTPAPSHFNRIADDLLFKAGIADRYHAQVVIIDDKLHPDHGKPDFDGSMFGHEGNYNIFVLPRPAGENKDKVLICVGTVCAHTLAEVEITAVMAHEIGHFINPPPHAGVGIHTVQTMSAAMVGASILCASPAAALVSLGAWMVTKLCGRRLRLLDEERADRFSLGLYPAPKALENAAKNMISNFPREPEEPAGLILRQFERAAEWVTRTHPDEATRFKNNDAYAVESAALHAAYGIPADPGAYAQKYRPAETPA
jgi:Zn-dependent protease with chaperone function